MGFAGPERGHITPVRK